MKKLSIIIPCYNMESFISRTIDSVLRQTYKDYELIIIDDGSTDQTLDILEYYENIDDRVKVYAKQNGGVSAARNTGIEKSTGEYILFLDGDDLIKEDLLENALKVFNNQQIDMFSYGYKIVDEKSQKILKIYSYKRYEKCIFGGKEFLKLYLRKKINQRMCSFIIKRKVFSENSILFDTNIKYAEDQDFQLRCMSKCTNIYYTAEEYFYYIRRAGSAINRKVDIWRMGEVEALIRKEEDLKYDIEPYVIRNYTCMHYVYLFREVIRKGAEREFIVKYIEKDDILNDFKIEFSKYNVITAIFIICYKLFLRRYLQIKYNI